jgi:DNA-binding transcriptional regulator YiaG
VNLNTVIGTAITKGALSATRKPLSNLRRDVADLKRQVAELKRLLREVQKGEGRRTERAPAPDAEEGKPLRIRPTGPMVRKVRTKLGLTQFDFAKLVDVSSLTVSKWETTPGRIRMRARTLAAFAAVRGMGKRATKKALADAQESVAK